MSDSEDMNASGVDSTCVASAFIYGTVAVTCAFLACLGAYVSSEGTRRTPLDQPMAWLFWAFVIATPVFAALSLLQGERRPVWRKAVTGVLVLWAFIALGLGLLPLLH